MQRFTGRQYLMIDIANSFGMDDQQYEVRLDWFKEHEAVLETLVKDAEEPAQFLAGVMAWRDTCEGIPTGYMVGHDACASGVQILAALSGCPTSALNCGLIGKIRQDVYTNGYRCMSDMLGTAGVLTRKPVKGALMTCLYGSKANPRTVFGEGTQELEMFYVMQDVIVPGVRQLKDDIQTLWQPYADDHRWTLVDGFEAVIKVMEKLTVSVGYMGGTIDLETYVQHGTESGISLAANITHSADGFVVREMGRRCNYDPKRVAYLRELDWATCGTADARKQDQQLLRLLKLAREHKFISMVLAEHLDALNYGHLTKEEHIEFQCLLSSVAEHKSFPVVCVHDCFKCHANNMNWVRWHYIEIMSQIARSEMMSAIASEITGSRITINKLSDNLHEEILRGEYALS